MPRPSVWIWDATIQEYTQWFTFTTGWLDGTLGAKAKALTWDDIDNLMGWLYAN